jgi:hypothetical protein
MPIVSVVTPVSAANAVHHAHWLVTANQLIIAITIVTNVFPLHQGNVTIKRIAPISLPVSVANA